MKAILLNQYGGVENLHLTEIETPLFSAQEVLIKVSSVSINPVDLKIRQGVKMVGRERDELPVILGWDLSGVIEYVGSEVTAFKAGDEVFAMINYPGFGNAYAEFVVARPEQLAHKPANISFSEAAAATLSALTAWQALTKHGSIKKGDKVLIHAASGGVGHFAVQMAKHLGAYVIGTSSLANREFVLGLGAHEHIDYKNGNIEELVHNADFILDPLGGENTESALRIVKPGGTVVSIVFGFTEALFLEAERLGVTAKNPQVRPDGESMAAIAGLLEKGHLRSYVGKVFPFEEMASAHLLLESGRSVGKVVLEL